MRIGLFFGSFNPVHVGHLIIANHILNHTDLEKIWMVVSPHNPFKKKSSLANNHDRLHLIILAIGDNPDIQASNIEFNLPQPSYTIDTLTYLKEKYPQHEFCLIMGGDNLKSFHKWKNYEQILEHHKIYVYQRPSYDLGDLKDHKSISVLKAPLLEISASFVRKCIAEDKSIQYLVPESVYKYLEETPIYKNLLKT